MARLQSLCFYLGFGMLATHELDAMANNEWRVLPFTSWLSNDAGQFVFIVAHIPLFAVLAALFSSQNKTIRYRTRLVLSAFLIVHGILHSVFVAHTNYEFESILSNTLIFGGAVCGMLYLAISLSAVAEE